MWFRLARRPLVEGGKGLRLGRTVNFDLYEPIALGRDVVISDGASLSVHLGAALVLGDRVFVGRQTVVAASESIQIGARTLIAEHCSIRDGDHQASARERDHETALRTAPIVIGDSVWVGAGARVLRGSKVGDGAVVAANSVVKGTVAPGQVVAGIPAKPVEVSL